MRPGIDQVCARPSIADRRAETGAVHGWRACRVRAADGGDLLLTANTLNLAADLAAMSEAMRRIAPAQAKGAASILGVAMVAAGIC